MGNASTLNRLYCAFLLKCHDLGYVASEIPV